MLLPSTLTSIFSKSNTKFPTVTTLSEDVVSSPSTDCETNLLDVGSDLRKFALILAINSRTLNGFVT